MSVRTAVEMFAALANAGVEFIPTRVVIETLKLAEPNGATAPDADTLRGVYSKPGFGLRGLIGEKAWSEAGATAEQDAAYAPLRAVLEEAFAQSAAGKGKERHANGKTFDRQPILEVSRIVGHGFPIGQAMKKAGEAAGMAKRGKHDHAVQECLGAIVYLAAAIISIREEKSLLD